MELDKRQEVVNQLSAEIEWDKSIIETVRNSSKDDESDIELMEKYFKMDENAIKVSNIRDALGGPLGQGLL